MTEPHCREILVFQSGPNVFPGSLVLLVKRTAPRIEITRDGNPAQNWSRQPVRDGQRSVRLARGPLRDDLVTGAENMSQTGKTFKLQPFLLQCEFELAEVDPVTITLQKRAYRPLVPINLRVAEDGYNPTYGNGADIIADWDKLATRSSEDPVTKVLSPDIDKTVLEVLTTGNRLKGTFEFSGGSGPKTITNAQLVSALGGETDFKLRAYFARSGYRSLNYDEVTVRKT
jgi:hypothetical protein